MSTAKISRSRNKKATSNVPSAEAPVDADQFSDLRALLEAMQADIKSLKDQVSLLSVGAPVASETTLESSHVNPPSSGSVVSAPIAPSVASVSSGGASPKTAARSYSEVTSGSPARNLTPDAGPAKSPARTSSLSALRAPSSLPEPTASSANVQASGAAFRHNPEWTKAKERLLKPTFWGSHSMLYCWTLAKSGPIPADTAVVFITILPDGSFQLERDLSEGQTKQIFLHLNRRHYEPVATAKTSSTGALIDPTPSYPVCCPEANDPMDICGGDPNVAAAVVACMQRVLPSLEDSAHQQALEIMEKLSSKISMKVGRTEQNGSCFFSSVACLFPAWPIHRQKQAIIDAAEGSQDTMSAILKELGFPTSTFDRESLPSEKPKSPSANSEAIPSKATRKSLSHHRTTPDAAARKSARNSDNRVSLVSDDEEEDAKDSDYLPSDDESDMSSDSDSGVAQVRPHRSAKSKKQNEKSSSPPKEPNGRIGSNKNDSLSVVWGLKKSTDKPKLIELVSRHASAPKPTLIKLVNERKRPGRFFHLVLHDSSNLAVRWRNAAAAVPGLTIKKYRDSNRPASSAKQGAPVSHHAPDSDHSALSAALTNSILTAVQAALSAGNRSSEDSSRRSAIPPDQAGRPQFCSNCVHKERCCQSASTSSRPQCSC